MTDFRHFIYRTYIVLLGMRQRQPTTFPLSEYLQVIATLRANDLEAAHRDNAFIKRLLPNYHHKRTDAGVYVLSYADKKYLYLNEQFGHLAEMPLREAAEGGIERSQRQLVDYDRTIHHNRVFGDFIREMSAIAPEEHPRYIMTTYYRIKTTSGKIRCVQQRSRFIKSTNDGKPLFAIGFLTDVTGQRNDSKISATISHESRPGLVFQNVYHAETKEQELDMKLVDVLRLMQQGLTDNAIAEKLFISRHAVDHRKRSLRKHAEARSLSTLLTYGFRHGYLE